MEMNTYEDRQFVGIHTHAQSLQSDNKRVRIMWDKYEQLKETLTDMGSVLVAYSGGVDSTFLLRVAHDTLGDRARGATIVSPLIPPDEYADAITLAQEMGTDIEVLKHADSSNPQILANTPDRCYFCKASICEQLKVFAKEHGYSVVVDGSNLDDLDDYRPGQRAAQECGMRSPLQEAGLTKSDIRALSRELGLTTWDNPSAACLASRIPYGTPITEEALVRIGRAERVLRELGFRQLRVRHHGNIARIEIPAGDFERILTHRGNIVEALRALGYAYITLDLNGFRSGSMNEVINKDGRR